MFDRKSEVVLVPGGAVPVVVTRLVQRYPLPCQRGEIFERLDHTRAAVCPVHDQAAGARVAGWGDAQAAVATECDNGRACCGHGRGNSSGPNGLSIPTMTECCSIAWSRLSNTAGVPPNWYTKWRSVVPLCQPNQQTTSAGDSMPSGSSVARISSAWRGGASSSTRGSPAEARMLTSSSSTSSRREEA